MGKSIWQTAFATDSERFRSRLERLIFVEIDGSSVFCGKLPKADHSQVFNTEYAIHPNAQQVLVYFAWTRLLLFVPKIGSLNTCKSIIIIIIIIKIVTIIIIIAVMIIRPV